MDCETWCVVKSILIGAAVALGIFFFGPWILFCLAALLLAAFAAAAGGPVATGISAAALLACIWAAMASNPGFVIFLAIMALALGPLLGAASYIGCTAECAEANFAAAAPGGTTQAIGATVGDLTCAGARNAVNLLETQLAAARAARDAQRERVAKAKKRLRDSRLALAAAGVAFALAAASWNLIALAAAALATAAATAAVAVWRAQVRARQVALAPLDAAVAALEGALAVARSVEEKACRDGRPGGGFDVSPGQERPGTIGTTIG